MASQMSIFTRTKTLFTKTLNPNLKSLSISTFTFLSQEPQLAESAPPPPSPLPTNPATGSPVYNENWRTQAPNSETVSQSLIPLGLLKNAPMQRVQALSQTLDAETLMNLFAEWMTSKRWSDMKEMFESWIRSFDVHGKPNKPDVGLYNHYLRANFMLNATTAALIDLVAQMEDFAILPDTASFNLVLKAMHQAGEFEAAEMWLQRMLQGGKDSLPDDETYDLLISLLLSKGKIDSALKYIDIALKSGYMLSMNVFTQCLRSCVDEQRPDALLSIIKKCKAMDQNKALCPTWNLCYYIAEVAVQEDNSELAFCALEFMANWIPRGEIARPPVRYSVDEGLVLSVLGTAGRTYSQKLLDASWVVLRRSLRNRVPNPESYLGKIYAHAALGDLQRAFSTLKEFETAYGNFVEGMEEMFSPFTSLHPLVVACSRKGFETLDSVYFQLESLSREEKDPYKSIAATNCVILGCANIWDLDRAYQTFEAMSSSFGLTPDIHSYNALIYAFGKLKKTFEASRVFEHLVSLGVKPNAKSYSLLVDAHLINRDQKAALSVIDEMINTGFVPSKETLKKVRRRCVREVDEESNDRVEALARKLDIRMNTENRKNILFNLEYSTGYA